jgi:hypothetical protein
MNLTAQMLILKSFFSEKDIVNSHISRISNFKVLVDERELKLPIMYWIPKLHKDPYKIVKNRTLKKSQHNKIENVAGSV